MTGEVETEEVIRTSHNDKTERDHPQEKKFGGEELEAKDHLVTIEPTAPIPYLQCLKKKKRQAVHQVYGSVQETAHQHSVC